MMAGVDNTEKSMFKVSLFGRFVNLRRCSVHLHALPFFFFSSQEVFLVGL
jgi:hypothetical protein